MLNIRNETPADIDAITTLTEAAFLNAPHTSHTEQFIVKALRKAGALSLSLVAEQDGRLVGHVALSPVIMSDGATGWFGLGPISVAPDVQHCGIGSQLMRAALGWLRSTGAAGCALVGDPAYYQRFGFKPEPGLVYPGIPAEYFQVLAFGSSIPQGEVTFHEAFSAVAP
jgi:putative acetyltransferase